jgi:ParB family transcriptional regulator, chromosome partitioning protein
MAAKKKAAKRTASPAKKNLAPSKTKRGLEANEVGLPVDAPSVSGLAGEVRAVGGALLAAYREPLSGQPLLLASLPLGAVEPTPFQRDLSPTHVKRLAQKNRRKRLLPRPPDRGTRD